MEKLFVTEINAETGEVNVREFTESEVKEHLAIQKSEKALEAQKEAKAKARESALAKLAALGLTEEEIASL